MKELFEIDESLSPWEQWKRRYKIYVNYCSEWEEYIAGSWLVGSLNHVGEGEDEEEAIADLCEKSCIPTFDEWKMKGGQSE